MCKATTGSSIDSNGVLHTDDMGREILRKGIRCAIHDPQSFSWEYWRLSEQCGPTTWSNQATVGRDSALRWVAAAPGALPPGASDLCG